jgi:type IV pilus assembly protein PilC
MPQYEWEGKTLTGEPKRGTSRAATQDALRASLRKDGVILAKSTEVKGTKEEHYNPKKKIKKLHIVLFTRQLSTMITSGLPLVQSLDILGNQVEDVNFRGIVREIKTKIEGGSRFADALRDYPQCFDELYVNLVVAGEEGGLLDNVLQRLAVYMEKSEKLKRKVKSAMIYPIAIITVAIGVTLVLLLFVIPVFEKMFKEMGAELPMVTQMVINLSHLIASIYGLIAVVVVAAVVVMLVQYYKTEGGRP